MIHKFVKEEKRKYINHNKFGIFAIAKQTKTKKKKQKKHVFPTFITAHKDLFLFFHHMFTKSCNEYKRIYTHIQKTNIHINQHIPILNHNIDGDVDNVKMCKERLVKVYKVDFFLNIKRFSL